MGGGGLTASKQALSIKTWAEIQAVGSSAQCFKQIWKVGKVGKVGKEGKVGKVGMIGKVGMLGKIGREGR